jgi:hypothetical protein
MGRVAVQLGGPTQFSSVDNRGILWTPTHSDRMHELVVTSAGRSVRALQQHTGMLALFAAGCNNWCRSKSEAWCRSSLV